MQTETIKFIASYSLYLIHCYLHVLYLNSYFLIPTLFFLPSLSRTLPLLLTSIFPPSLSSYPSTLLQGILGTDNRRYALDLFRLFPPDPNYTQLEEEEKEGKEGRKGGKEEGKEEGVRKEGREEGTRKEGEKNYRHKLAVLRPELIETFMQ